jgi:dTDP-4-dehydrorhamnose 3,5-epimerase
MHFDERGVFVHLEPLWPAPRVPITQINLSTISKKGTLKGIHWQTGDFAEYRQVTCLVGKVYDVAIDIRPDSPTFLQWQGVNLEGLDGQSVLIPPGFGHAIQALTDNCMVHYVHSSTYEPAHEAGLSALDPFLGIPWPLEPTLMSDRDKSLPTVEQFFGPNPQLTTEQ